MLTTSTATTMTALPPGCSGPDMTSMQAVTSTAATRAAESSTAKPRRWVTRFHVVTTTSAQRPAQPIE